MKTITVNHVSKAYKQYHSRWGRLLEWMIPSTHKRYDLKWILRDIHFDVNPGEAVGLVGINGAGKSTLLKMITGTTQPTAGNININGRVAALLELGMGFHPDFTGRQNVFMAGQLMGFQATEIAAMMPEIEAFAEIGDYIDQPVRVYSSGMQMRLAFSVATAIRPDVLIVDEALSVGDTYFQHKSFERIKEFKKHGTTLLIVSHDKQAIQSICDRAILLNSGRVELEGNPEEVMDYYNALIAKKGNEEIRRIETEDNKVQVISGSGEAQIYNVEISDDNDKKIEVVTVGQKIKLKIKIKTNEHIPELVIGYMIKDRVGQVIFGTNSYHLKKVMTNIEPEKELNAEFAFNANLGTGSYSIAVALHAGHNHVFKNYEWRDLAVVFDVINADKDEFVGSCWIPSTFRSN